MAATDGTPVLHTYIVERGFNICINKEICEKKQEILYSFYKKYMVGKMQLFERLNTYIHGLELLKYINQYIIKNDTFLKSDIYYNHNSILFKFNEGF